MNEVNENIEQKIYEATITVVREQLTTKHKEYIERIVDENINYIVEEYIESV